MSSSALKCLLFLYLCIVPDCLFYVVYVVYVFLSASLHCSANFMQTMHVGSFLWWAAIVTFISNQPYYFNTSKWAILHLYTLKTLSTIIFLLACVPFLIYI